MSGEDVLARLGDASWQLAIGAAAVWILCCKLPGNVRGWLWRLVALKTMLALIVLIPLPWLGAEVSPAISSFAADAIAPVDAAVSAPGVSTVEPETLLFALWAIGALIAFAVLATRAIRAERMVRALAAVGWVGSVEGCRVIQTDHASGPFIVGLSRPTILLPRAGDTSIPLAHELAHAERRDLIWDLAFGIFRAIFWFHPLAWLAMREHRQACEEASDALAIARTGASPSQYATALLAYATRPRPPIAGLASSASDLKRRIYQMHRPRVSITLVVAASAATLVLLVPARLVARQVDPTAAPTRTLDQQASEMVLLPYVSKRVGITREQAGRITKVWMDISQRIREIGDTAAEMKRKGVPVAERVAFEEREKNKCEAGISRSILAVLDSNQQYLLRQVALENAGPLALGERAVGEMIGLPAAKISKIANLAQDARRAYMKNSMQEAHENLERARNGSNLSPADRKRFLDLQAMNDQILKAPQYQRFRAVQSLADEDPRKQEARKALRDWFESNPYRLNSQENDEFNRLVKANGNDPTRKDRAEEYRRRYKDIKTSFNDRAMATLSSGERAKWAALLRKPRP